MGRHISLVTWCIALGSLGASAPLLAHHGTAGSYDQSKTVTIQGVVKQFLWRNPHTALFVVGMDTAGTPQTYALQGSSPESLVKSGFSRTTLKPGDNVVIKMHPGYNDPLVGEWLEDLFWVNGKQIQNANVGQSSKENGYSQ